MNSNRNLFLVVVFALVGALVGSNSGCQPEKSMLTASGRAERAPTRLVEMEEVFAAPVTDGACQDASHSPISGGQAVAIPYPVFSRLPE